MGIKIVTDSTAYLSAEQLESYQITEVSLVVNFEDHSYPEAENRDFTSFYEKLKSSDKTPSTSQPSSGDFLDVYQKLTADGSQVISFHISSRLSGTVQSAQTAASMLKDQDITVVDSLLTINALRYIVLEAAAMAQAGRSREEILQHIEKIKNNTQVYFLVDTLVYLKRGGRIGAASSLLGSVLQVKPILQLKEGVIDVYAKVRTKEKAMRFLLEEVEKIIGGAPEKYFISAAHVGDEAAGEEFKRSLQKMYPGQKIELAPIGPVIGSHVGPGTVAMHIVRLSQE